MNAARDTSYRLTCIKEYLKKPYAPSQQEKAARERMDQFYRIHYYVSDDKKD